MGLFGQRFLCKMGLFGQRLTCKMGLLGQRFKCKMGLLSQIFRCKMGPDGQKYFWQGGQKKAPPKSQPTKASPSKEFHPYSCASQPLKHATCQILPKKRGLRQERSHPKHRNKKGSYRKTLCKEKGQPHRHLLGIVRFYPTLAFCHINIWVLLGFIKLWLTATSTCGILYVLSFSLSLSVLHLGIVKS